MTKALRVAVLLAILCSGATAWHVYPVAGYSSTAGFVLGGLVGTRWSRGSFRTTASWSTKGEISLVPELLLAGTPIGLDAELRIEKRFDRRFYGYGNGGDPDVYAEYDTEFQDLSLLARLDLLPRTDLSVGGVVRHSTVYGREDDSLWSTSPTERYGSEWTAGPALKARRPFQSPVPGYVYLSLLHQEGRRASYSVAGGGAALFFPISGSTAIRVHGNLSRHFGTSGTPFWFQQYLGYDQGLRGYDDNRFSGNVLLVANLELRQLVWRVGRGRRSMGVGLVGFVDAGETAGDISGLHLDGLHYDAGVGGRLYLPGGVVMVADFAFSPEGFKMATGFDEQF
jgi:hypothetical protein